MTAPNYVDWLARLDALWSAADCERNRMEMQTLLGLIEQYEQHQQQHPEQQHSSASNQEKS